MSTNPPTPLPMDGHDTDREESRQLVAELLAPKPAQPGTSRKSKKVLQREAATAIARTEHDFREEHKRDYTPLSDTELGKHLMHLAWLYKVEPDDRTGQQIKHLILEAGLRLSGERLG